MQIDSRRFRIALIERGLRQIDIANKLNLAHSTFSAWVRGIGRPPAGFIARVERAMGVPVGSLSATAGASADGAPNREAAR